MSMTTACPLFAEDEMIKIINKEQFKSFKQSVLKEEQSVNEVGLIEVFSQWIDLNEDEEIDVYAYFQDSQPIALLRFSEEDLDDMLDDDEAEGKITLIGDIIVHPQHRLQGIGRVLVQFAIENATTEWIMADPVNIEAIHFFESLQFKPNESFTTDNWPLFYQRTEQRQ